MRTLFDGKDGIDTGIAADFMRLDCERRSRRGAWRHGEGSDHGPWKARRRELVADIYQRAQANSHAFGEYRCVLFGSRGSFIERLLFEGCFVFYRPVDLADCCWRLR